jgi:hypothetical protein
VSTGTDGAGGYISLESDRRECSRYEVEGMKFLLAWPEDADVLPLQGTIASLGVIGVSDKGTIPLSQSRSLGASLGLRERDESTASKFIRTESTILNISQSGLSLIVACLPPEDRKLWVGMGGAEPGEWAEVAVRSVSEPEPGRYRLGLTFAHGCPYSLFRLAVLKTLDQCSVSASTASSR